MFLKHIHYYFLLFLLIKIKGKTLWVDDRMMITLRSVKRQLSRGFSLEAELVAIWVSFAVKTTLIDGRWWGIKSLAVATIKFRWQNKFLVESESEVGDESFWDRSKGKLGWETKERRLTFAAVSLHPGGRIYSGCSTNSTELLEELNYKPLWWCC